MAFKLRSADVPAIPQPAPLFEIYVYAPDMEGIHLRGGRIARGGIRWSDRMDYRTEVFGLMRAQMTKNAVIVPAGAKGGFFLKEPAGRSGAAARRGQAPVQSATSRRCSTSPTTSSDDGRTVPPDGVRVHDEQDPTSSSPPTRAPRRSATPPTRSPSGAASGWATRSPPAARRAMTTRALGITAKGAWESVKRHFRELGVDPERDVVHASVGIGDMSGDVFGNGMLLSGRSSSIAAYDHRHVFLDPDPDPERSLCRARAAVRAERLVVGRLRPRGDLRGRRRLQPRRQVDPADAAGARARWTSSDEALAPTDLIRAILRAPVDLLWNGGIGTVVKASTESDADALDRSSDAIRVDGREVRARVVGEGGNLGFTHRARIEYANGRRPRRRGRAHQRRLHRQLGRRRLLRPRGQPEDPARPRRAARGAAPRGARRAARRGHRGRRRTRVVRLVPAGADPVAGGAVAAPRASSPTRT